MCRRNQLLRWHPRPRQHLHPSPSHHPFRRAVAYGLPLPSIPGRGTRVRSLTHPRQITSPIMRPITRARTCPIVKRRRPSKTSRVRPRATRTSLVIRSPPRPQGLLLFRGGSATKSGAPARPWSCSTRRYRSTSIRSRSWTRTGLCRVPPNRTSAQLPACRSPFVVRVALSRVASACGQR